MDTEPIDGMKSPCCGLPTIKLDLGQNELQHWACSECHALFIWNGKHFVPCQNQDKHRQLAYAAPFPWRKQDANSSGAASWRNVREKGRQ